jgi:hypothetical protein
MALPEQCTALFATPQARKTVPCRTASIFFAALHKRARQRRRKPVVACDGRLGRVSAHHSPEAMQPGPAGHYFALFHLIRAPRPEPGFRARGKNISTSRRKTDSKGFVTHLWP